MYEFMSNAHPGTGTKGPYAVLVKLVTMKTNADNQLVCCILFVQLVLMKQGRGTERGGGGKPPTSGTLQSGLPTLFSSLLHCEIVSNAT